MAGSPHPRRLPAGPDDHERAAARRATSSCATPSDDVHPGTPRSPLRSSPPGTSPAPTPARARPAGRGARRRGRSRGSAGSIGSWRSIGNHSLCCPISSLTSANDHDRARSRHRRANVAGSPRCSSRSALYARSSLRVSRAIAASISPSRSIQRGLTPAWRYASTLRRVCRARRESGFPTPSTCSRSRARRRSTALRRSSSCVLSSATAPHARTGDDVVVTAPSNPAPR